MLKVLIADDEKKVCQLIANIVDWEKLGYEIVGTANDGITAYNFIKDNEIDVLLVDIRMPECDGLELIKKLKELDRNIHIVIISGYGQFEYVQAALHYGVEEYLLKPIRKKDIVAILEKISDKHKTELQEARKWEDMKQELDRNKERIKNSFLLELLKHPEKFGGFYSTERINRGYHCSFDDTCYQAMRIRIIFENQENISTVKKIVLNKAVKILNQKLSEYVNEMTVSIIDDDIYGLLNGTEENLQLAYGKLKKTKMELLQLQEAFGSMKIYIALGQIKTEMQDIMESITEASITLADRFYFSSRLILKYRPDRETEKSSVYVDNAFKKQFLGHIEILDMESQRNELQKIANRMEKSEKKDGQTVEKVYKEILQLFYFGTNNYGISIPDEYQEQKEQVLQFDTIAEVTDYLYHYMETSVNTWMQEKKLIENKPIRIAKRYIAENYYKPLTLEIVSRETGFNPNYFSSMFKKEAGVNFSEYLIKVRIENAKEMLLNTEQSVEDISFAVGYSDIKYFSRIFKKYMGVTPTEFRKLYN